MNEKTIYKVLLGITVLVGIWAISVIIYSFSITKLISLIVVCVIIFQCIYALKKD